MATNYPHPRARIDRGLVRDVLALVLVIAGVVGASVAAFAVDWRLGLASLSAAAIATGVFLGYER